MGKAYCGSLAILDTWEYMIHYYKSHTAKCTFVSITI